MVGDHKRPHSTRQARLEKRQKIRHSFGIWIGLNRVWKYFCGLVDNNYMYMYMNAYDISSMIVLADTCVLTTGASPRGPDQLVILESFRVGRLSSQCRDI